MIRLLDGAGGRRLELRGVGSLADHLRRNGLPLNTRCGQRGVCKGCLVEIVSGPDRLVHTTIRACQYHGPFDGLVIRVPSASRLEMGVRIDDDFNCAAPAMNPPVRRLRFQFPRSTVGSPTDFATQLRDSIHRALESQAALTIPPGIIGALSQLAVEDTEVEAIIALEAPDRWRVVRVTAGEPVRPLLGLAVDIGTTTVATLLTNLETGEVLGRASRLNAQVRVADDVASRIVAAGQPDGVQQLHTLLHGETLRPLVKSLLEHADAQPTDIVAVAFAGNTVMTHLALGLDPTSMGHAPFEPVVLQPDPISEREMHLGIARDAIAWLAPAVAAYVGGDIVADIYSSSALGRTGPILLVDIGTNGEMVLIHGGRMVACATAAGPAFEGAGLFHGCRATEGAIEHVTLSQDGRLVGQTIGGKKAVGLCGSGAVEALARAYEAGYVNELGRFDRNRLDDGTLFRQVISHGVPTYGLVLCPASESGTKHDIFLTEYDISELLKAKAAIAAGIASLLAEEGIEAKDLGKILLAGGFARHLDIASAIAIGLLPDLPLDRFEIVGNGSLAGAWHCLLDSSALPACREIARMPTVLELNLLPDFEDCFIDNLSLPSRRANIRSHW
jgi:uncharacterized 2Fe-2S/4Fe-4S cluster protein (DUF4445 family)